MHGIPGLDGVVAVGGDGTALEVALPLVGTSIPLGIIPVGTGNDLARSLGLPPGKGVSEYLEIIAKGSPRPVDVVRYHAGGSGGIFLNVASVGFDAAVTRAAHRMKGWADTSLVYLLALFPALGEFRFADVKIEMDGRGYEGRALMVVLGNGRYYGGGVKINPQGVVDDGFLDLVVLEKVALALLIVRLPELLLGRHDRLPFVRHHRCRSVRIDSPESLPVNVDGEIKGALPFTAEVKARSLNIFLPGRAA